MLVEQCISQSAYPCIFMITDYSAKISFTGNHAERGIGHHMYGASVRGYSCSIEFIAFVNGQGKPHCFYLDDKPDGYVSISFDPGLNKILSMMLPGRLLCLCETARRGWEPLIIASRSLLRQKMFTTTSSHLIRYMR